MNRIKSIILTLFLILSGISLFAQANPEVPAGFMRSNGKIYVVVAVVVTILLGLVMYVYNLDRKISRMEKEK